VASLALASCAKAVRVPAPEVLAQARTAPSYSARLNVRLDGPTLRARTRVLLAFERPDALRVEVPGPAGARLIAVARGGRMWAVFPADRAVFSGQARAEDFESLLGVALAPAEVMDLLTGAPSPRVRDHRVEWGAALPRRVRATLPDGARIDVRIEDAEAPAALGPAAFTEPPHAGYRAVDAEQARALWSR
jgi:hypothetical protein